ncbi:MAG: hypothetical protein MN733_06000 [Nitrososphaera sp.]|nr:hypothetical protein [Nitrososphaera sp.]
MDSRDFHKMMDDKMLAYLQYVEENESDYEEEPEDFAGWFEDFLNWLETR